MKNQASVREKRSVSNNIIGHGEFSPKRYSLWLIIFIGVIFFFYAYYCPGEAFALNALDESKSERDVVRRVLLDNGLTVLLKENHNHPLVSLFLGVMGGSVQEGEFIGSGVSHFVEHMVFKGTRARAVGEISREIESYGGTFNAFASYDYTGYKITVPAEFTFPAIEILADMMMNATFDAEELERERQVVLKEIKLSYDSPQRMGVKLLWQTAFSKHPYKYPILGKEDLFKSLSRKDLIKYYQEHYIPNNMVFSVVGDIDAKKTISVINETFKDFLAKPIKDFKIGPEPEQKKIRKKELKYTTGLTYLLLAFHSVALTNEDCFALDILATILGAGESSRLYKLICMKKRLAYSIQAGNYTPKQPGLFVITCLLEEASRKRVQSLILDQIRTVKKRAVTEDELANAKNKIMSSILFQNQTIEAQARDLVSNEVITGDFRNTEKYIQKIKEVIAEDILRVANKYLQRDRLSIVALIPEENLVNSNLPTRLDDDFKIGVENLTSDIRESNTKKYVLDNGITLLIRENKDLPLVSIKAVFKGGLRVENEDSNGLSNLVAGMLDKGTKTKNAGKIAYLIESKGGFISSYSGNNSFGLSLNLLSKDFDQMLELFADLIINSTFPQRALKRQKENTLAQLKTQEDSIFETGRKLLKATFFQDHPYRLPIIGTEKSIKQLKRKDLKNFHRNFCVGNNMVLAIFGDVDEQKALMNVKRFFAKLKAGNYPLINPPEEPQAKTTRSASKLLHKKQSLVLMGFPGTSVYTSDRYVLEVLCQILSQTSGRLFTQIREKSGLAYSLGAYQVLGLDPGYLVIYVATSPENAERVKSEILSELELIKQGTISEKELLQAKRTILGKRLINLQTNSVMASEGALDELYGLGYNHHLEYNERISSVQAEDIQRCAKQYFNFDNYALVVVSPVNLKDLSP